MSAFFFVSLSLFVFETAIIYEAQLPFRFENNFFLWLSILTSIFVLYQLKLLVIRLLGFIFKKETVSEEYIFNISFFNQNLGLFLFPVVICMAFMRVVSAELLFYCGLALISLIFIYRLYRSLPWGMGNNIISKYYLFLYLCTLEILPLVVLIKVFVGEM